MYQSYGRGGGKYVFKTGGRGRRWRPWLESVTTRKTDGRDTTDARRAKDSAKLFPRHALHGCQTSAVVGGRDDTAKKPDSVSERRPSDGFRESTFPVARVSAYVKSSCAGARSTSPGEPNAAAGDERLPADSTVLYRRRRGRETRCVRGDGPRVDSWS